MSLAGAESRGGAKILASVGFARMLRGSRKQEARPSGAGSTKLASVGPSGCGCEAALRFVRAFPVVGLLLLPGGPPLQPPQVLAVRVADYVGDEGTGRVHAEIGAELRRDAGGQRLRLRLSATGPRVDPVPGFEGVPGANRITARELGQLLEAGELQMRTHSVGDTRDGELRVVRRGRVPVRGTGADGGVDLHAETAQEFVLEVAADSGPLADGDYVSEILARGVPRLRVRFVLGAQPVIASIESLGGEDVRF